jgi:hypothetical protein
MRHDARVRAADEQRVRILSLLYERAELRFELREVLGAEALQAALGTLDIVMIGHGRESAGARVLSTVTH